MTPDQKADIARIAKRPEFDFARQLVEMLCESFPELLIHVYDYGHAVRVANGIHCAQILRPARFSEEKFIMLSPKDFKHLVAHLSQ